jgi:hypothetical protein
MKRFIDLTHQIHSGNKFAWYDTVVDQFEEWSGICTWETWEEFELDYTGDDILRYRKLVPVWVFGD